MLSLENRILRHQSSKRLGHNQGEESVRRLRVVGPKKKQIANRRAAHSYAPADDLSTYLLDVITDPGKGVMYPFKLNF
jgi:hypothetical protein